MTLVRPLQSHKKMKSFFPNNGGQSADRIFNSPRPPPQEALCADSMAATVLAQRRRSASLQLVGGVGGAVANDRRSAREAVGSPGKCAL